MDERMSDERVKGPKNQGAAMAMGDIMASWDAELTSPDEQWSRTLIHFGNVYFDGCTDRLLERLDVMRWC